MKLYTDYYFHIGYAHLRSGKPCQDYAYAQVFKQSALAVVSDGCSGGGRTDIGARLISQATISALRYLRQERKEEFNQKDVIEVDLNQKIKLRQTQTILEVEYEDLLATCLYAYFTPVGGFIRLEGDGCLALKYKSGKLELVRVEWKNNIPYYPIYSEFNLDAFYQAHGNDLEAKVLSQERWIKNGSEFEKVDQKNLSLQGDLCLDFWFNAQELADLEFVAIFSDGITQIDNIDWKEAAQELLAFKGVRGEFAKRRMIRFIRDSQKIGRGPIDDIAYAVIRIES